VCGAETVGMTHWRSVEYTADQLLGVAENPIRHEIEKVAERVGLAFSVNVVLNRRGDLVHVRASLLPATVISAIEPVFCRLSGTGRRGSEEAHSHHRQLASRAAPDRR
jgi:nickel-dependent lactate racemase